MDKLKGGDTVEIVGPDIYGDDTYRGEIKRIDFVDEQEGRSGVAIQLTGGVGVKRYAPSSLKRVIKADPATRCRRDYLVELGEAWKCGNCLFFWDLPRQHGGGVRFEDKIYNGACHRFPRLIGKYVANYCGEFISREGAE